MSRGRGLKIALSAGVVLLVLMVIAAAIAVKPLARRMAVAQALEHGVELEFDDLSLGIGWVKIKNARFTLVGVPEIRGTIRELEVTLSGLKPAGIRSTGMNVEAEGSAPRLVLAITTWTKSYPHTFRLPAQADDVNVTWRQKRDGPPWVQLYKGTVQRAASATSFQAERTVLGICPEREDGAAQCPELGRIGASWTADEAVVALGFGATDLVQAPVRLDVRYSQAQPVADIQLQPVDLRRLAGPFGVTLPIKNVTGSANVHLELPKGTGSGPISGTLSAQLKGFVPPHPRELDGFVFGDVTTLDSKIAINELRERADLTDVKVTAGAFKLGGSGSIEREQDHGRIKMELKGNLPCSALAQATVDSYLAKTLGKIPGDLARQLIGGSVGITVKIDGISSDLPNTKVDKIIGIGCGLKPLKLPDIDLGKLPPLPPIPSGLPPLPSGFPAPPKIDIKIETPKKDDK